MSTFVKVIHDKKRETYKRNSSNKEITKRKNYSNKKYNKNTSEKKLQQGRKNKRDQEWTYIFLKKRQKILAVKITRKSTKRKENNNVIDTSKTEYKVPANENKKRYKDILE